MDMPTVVCGYSGGMNKDSSSNNYPNTCYYDARNYRVITADSAGLSDTSLSSIKGNAASFTIPDSGVLLGWAVLIDALIILVHADGEANPDRIYRIPLVSLITASNITLTNVYYWTEPTFLVNHLVYWNDLRFDVLYPIKVVANYESDKIKKIYWVDSLNTLRHLNIVYDSIYNDLTSLDAELLEISPNHIYGEYTITETSGGTLKAGRIQYSYQLYSVSGTETIFAPPSALYNLTTYTPSDGKDFVGNEIETIVNKALKVTITLATATSTTFNRIRLVALEYEMYGDVPTIRVVKEQDLTSDTVVFYDYGETIGELVLEEFQTVKNDIVPTTLEVKNRYLFAGNITEKFFDIDDTVAGLVSPAVDFFDSRAYRWRYYASTVPLSGSESLTVTSDKHAQLNIPGYYPVGDSYDTDVYVDTLTDAGWIIRVKIGAPANAATKTGFIALTGISSIDADIVLSFHVTVGGWTSSLTLRWDGVGTGYSYTAIDANTGWLYIHGSHYGITKPSTLSPSYPGSYDKDAVTTLSYTYTYTYTSTSSGVECVVNKGLSGETVIDGGAGPDFTILQTVNGRSHDCINTFNNIDNDGDTSYTNEFKYKKITGIPVVTDLGGTGPYISYSFITESIKAGTVELDGAGGELHPIVVSSGTSDAGYKDPQNVMDYTGYQRGEVYPFGIVAYDLKGRPSYAKWIADIRFPRMSEILRVDAGFETYDNSTFALCIPDADPTNIMHANALGIRFTINWDAIASDYPGLLDLLSGFQIVRMQRTENDCTIKASGIIVPTHTVVIPSGSNIRVGSYSTYQITGANDYQNNALTAVAGITSNNVNINKTLVEILSPEIVLNKNIILDKTNDFFEVVGYIDNVQANQSNHSVNANDTILAADYTIGTYTTSAMTVTPLQMTAAHITTDWKRSIVDGVICGNEAHSPISRTLNLAPYTARGYDGKVNASNPEMTYKGTSFVGAISSAFTNVEGSSGVGNGQAMYGYYRRSLGYSIYGGNTFSERSTRGYIEAGHFTAVSTSGTVNYDVYGGDTYINPFMFYKLYFDSNPEYLIHSGQVVVTFPVESMVNISYRSDKTAKYFFPVESDSSGRAYFEAELRSIGLYQFPNTYPIELTDLCRYNSAYSAENNGKAFLTKPFDYRGINEQPSMVTSSELKTSGEYRDSWLVFKYNNYLLLEGKFGAITRLINSRDKLVAFQQRGIAALAVLDRELIQTTNTAQLAVGSGGILARYDYLSRKNGTSIYESIVDTDEGLYFYDSNSPGIYRLLSYQPTAMTGGVYRTLDNVESMSDAKGMKSYFSSHHFTSLIACFDKRNRDVLFAPLTSEAEDTLVFSGFLDAFTGFHTLRNSAKTKYVSRLIPFDKYLLSSIDDNKFYLHDAGNYNQFYGDTIPSTLTVLCNPSKNAVVSFQVIQWLMDVTNNGVEVPNETFQTVQITDTHQDTGVLSVATDVGIKRRFRKWRMNIFRDTDGSEGRIRDSWIKVVFTYTPQDTNNKAVVHPIECMVQPTKIH